MPPVKYSSSCPSTRVVVDEITRSCLYCDFTHLDPMQVTEHMWRDHPLKMRRKKHLLTSHGIAARKRQISESQCCDSDNYSCGGSPDSPMMTSAATSESGKNSDDECAYNLREKCTLGEPLPKRSPATNIRSAFMSRTAAIAGLEEETQLVYGLQSLGRSSSPNVASTASNVDRSNWSTSPRHYQRSSAMAVPKQQLHGVWEDWNRKPQSDKALDLSIHGRKPQSTASRETQRSTQQQQTSNTMDYKPTVLHQSSATYNEPNEARRPTHQQEYLSMNNGNRPIYRGSNNQFNFPVEISKPAAPTGNKKNSKNAAPSQYVGPFATNKAAAFYHAKEISNLEALSTVATQILYGNRGFINSKQQQKAENKPIVAKEEEVTKCANGRSLSTFTPMNVSNAAQSSSSGRTTTTTSKNKVPVMSDEGVRKLETAVKNINCFDPNEGSTIMPMRIENTWKQVRAKRIGGAWLVQIPNQSNPVVFVPQSQAPLKCPVTDKSKAAKHSPLVKSLFEPNKPCGSLMKKLLLQKTSVVNNSRT